MSILVNSTKTSKHVDVMDLYGFELLECRFINEINEEGTGYLYHTLGDWY